jgi:hypothetical protein
LEIRFLGPFNFCLLNVVKNGRVVGLQVLRIPVPPSVGTRIYIHFVGWFSFPTAFIWDFIFPLGLITM